MHPQTRPTCETTKVASKVTVANKKPAWFGDQRAISLGYCCELHMLAARYADESRLALLKQKHQTNGKR
jgi:hypothetical protein